MTDKLASRSTKITDKDILLGKIKQASRVKTRAKERDLTSRDALLFSSLFLRQAMFVCRERELLNIISFSCKSRTRQSNSVLLVTNRFAIVKEMVDSSVKPDNRSGGKQGRRDRRRQPKKDVTSKVTNLVNKKSNACLT